MRVPRTRPGPKPPPEGFVEAVPLAKDGEWDDAFGAFARELPGEKRILKVPGEKK